MSKKITTLLLTFLMAVLCTFTVSAGSGSSSIWYSITNNDVSGVLNHNGRYVKCTARDMTWFSMYNENSVTKPNYNNNYKFVTPSSSYSCLADIPGKYNSGNGGYLYYDKNTTGDMLKTTFKCTKDYEFGARIEGNWDFKWQETPFI